jgi:hypothetical protein
MEIAAETPRVAFRKRRQLLSPTTFELLSSKTTPADRCFPEIRQD